MIFAHTYKLVLAGKKSQTRRLKYVADTLGFVTDAGIQRKAVWDNSYTERPRTRWVVGRTYAVQPERCHTAVCHILITDLREEADPTGISEGDARAEGFESADAFRAAWKSLHRSKPVQPVWVIEFKVVKRVSDR